MSTKNEPDRAGQRQNAQSQLLDLQDNARQKQLQLAAEQLALRHGDSLRPGEALWCELNAHEGLQRLSLHLEDKAKDRDFRLHVDFMGSVGADSNAHDADLQDSTAADSGPQLSNSQDSESQDSNLSEQALLDALDFIDGVLQEYFASDREAWPPLDPSPYTFEGRQLWLCGGLHRPRAEAEAEALLAQDAPAAEEV